MYAVGVSVLEKYSHSSRPSSQSKLTRTFRVVRRNRKVIERHTIFSILRTVLISPPSIPPQAAGLLSSEHFVSGGPAINGWSQSASRLKPASNLWRTLERPWALRLAIDRQNLTALPASGGKYT